MALKELLSELEKEIQFRNVDNKLYINQPSLITVSSDVASEKTMNATGDSFYTFTCDLKKPAIGAKSLQLISANIPQAKGISFSDTELLFPYYKIQTQTNVNGHTIYKQSPNINTLYYVRLLPSYYPSNIIPNAQNYGFNKTFNNYQELSDELAKSCAADLLEVNKSGGEYSFIPNDVLISYNSSENKFQFKGNNVNTPFPILEWNAEYLYILNDLVSYSGKKYIALGTTINNAPNVSPTAWREYTGNIWYTYFVAGYDDPNVMVLQKNIHYNIFATNYNNSLVYVPANLVYFENLIYESILAGENIGNIPSISPNAWRVYDPQDQGNPDFFYGRYGLTNILGIPTAPFSPGKTLAKRLGFPWGGQFTWDFGNPLDPLYYNATSGSGILFWNRLRPIPDYEFLPPEVGVDPPVPIPNNNPFTSDTYIAEAYCNLVYSSILNIYSEITTASSIDTQSTNNILSIIPINCGQLGITFTNNFLENPLTKINSDIYQIRIELRDEIGEPYYISNNGIITLMLKISY